MSHTVFLDLFAGHAQLTRRSPQKSQLLHQVRHARSPRLAHLLVSELNLDPSFQLPLLQLPPRLLNLLMRLLRDPFQWRRQLRPQLVTHSQ